MAEGEGSQAIPAEFDGKVRVFPLPNLVMFPHNIQALHIFEPRYREMLDDALQGDHLIAMALLASGWERDYDARPPLRDVLCLGRVISSTRMEDGKYNILLLGLRRAQLTCELPPDRSFREAEVQLLQDVYPPSAAADRPGLYRRLIDCFQRMVPKDPTAQAQLAQLLVSQVPLGVITDLVAFSLPMRIEEKQRILDELNVDQRAEMLLRHLDQCQAESSAETPHEFPPPFSAN